ncbi:MAG TPA: RHS repeat-associated core domain-containing protein [Thermoanaerobaculia bacterium]
MNGQTTTTSYGYDPAGRVTDVTTGSATTHYGYDDNGNRTSVTNASGTIAATYDPQDRLTTYNGASYLYSDNGELQKKIDAQGTTLYNYDVLGNLRSVTLPDGRLIEYVIDASNRRVGKKVNGTLVAGWVYGDQLRIIAETDGSGTVTKRFVYGSRTNVPAYMVWQGATYRIISDHLGSPRYVIQANAGTLAEAIAYDEFGNVLSDSNPKFVPFGFAGGLSDADTTFTRFGARDYDPHIGRWAVKDAILFRGHESNIFEYAFSDPVNWNDQSGFATVRNISGDTVIISGDPCRVNGSGDQVFGVVPPDGRVYGGADNPIPSFPNASQARTYAKYLEARPGFIVPLPAEPHESHLRHCLLF